MMSVDKNTDNQPFKPIPLGVSSWRKLIDQNKLIVDKTAKLGVLVSLFDFVFFSRPRRMGKTTLCSMLRELFTHGDHSFAGTAIYGHWPETKRYPVISLSFAYIKCSDAKTFEASLCTNLAAAYAKAGFPEAMQLINETSFEQLKVKLDYLVLSQGQRLVFLIDEWDYPLSKHLDDPQLFASLQSVLSDFYGWMRQQNETNARFILVTGIMRYRETSLFAGQNMQDISMDPTYADLLGYTKEDIEKSFARYIPLAADNLDITTAELWQQLELNYDGFCFDHDASVKLYSPIAINKFFAPLDSQNFIKTDTVKLSFEPFWMGSSAASVALRAFLSRRKYDVNKLLEKYSNPVIMNNSDLTSPVKASEVTLDQIMLQSGMLSIKEITEEAKQASTIEMRSYKCELTNYEVASEFRTVILAYMANTDIRDISSKLLHVQEELLNGNIAKLCANLNQLLCNSRYDISDEADDKKERIYRTLFKLCMMSHLVNVDDEVSNNYGRCDLVASTQDTIYAFELKRIQSDKPDAKCKLLDEAEQQMVQNDYGNNLITKGKVLLWVVLVISDKYRQICAWRSIKRTYSAVAPQIERYEDLVELIKVENQK